jgi:CRP-like cAMP-binding protein/Fe-S-cluster-containing dehydrogenase component
VSDSTNAVAQRAEREVMACIGCHDCMLACPLPEALTVTIAQLNAAVHQRTITDPRVIEFAVACTQCRQCVPACPADLSRADMVLYNKMKIEDSVPDHPLFIQVGREVYPSSFTLDTLANELARLHLFAGVSPRDLRRLLLKVTLRQLAPWEVLCREGEFHERLIVVLSGALEQTSAVAGYHGGTAPHPQQARILVIGPGSFFGELAVMADQPEPFTVAATAPSVVLEMPKAAVHRLMDQSPAFARTMDELYARRALWTYAKKPGVLGALSERAIQELLSSAELVQLKPGQLLFREGSPPEHVYLVRSGFLRVTRAAPPQLLGTPAGEQVLVYFREGDLFGALPLLFHERAQVFSVHASSRAEVIRIPAASLSAVMAKYPEANALVQQGALEVERVARTAAPAPPPGASPAPAPRPGGKSAGAMPSMALPLAWNVLVDHGVVQGREVLVIDQTRCVNCQNCVDACGRRHGLSRLELRGLQVEHLLFPTACRHCDDPVCLLCSVNGIVRRPGGEISIVDDNCIGCGACAERCPYGNIRMHELDPPSRGIVERFLDFLRGDSERRPGDSKLQRKAVKCDLCAEYQDYACVTACPVGAAFRVDPRSALGQGEVMSGGEGAPHRGP